MSTNTPPKESLLGPSSLEPLPEAKKKRPTSASTTNLGPYGENDWDLEAAIKRACMYPNQLDALNWIVQWEHERAGAQFFRTGKREANFRQLMGRVIQEHTQMSMATELSPWPGKPAE